MRTKIFASFAIAAATLLTACSDNATTPPPSKAEQCAAGLSADCIMGTWSINGPTVTRTVGTDVVYLIEPSHDLSASPATLKFYVDEKQANKFHFANSPVSKAGDCTPTNIYGNWNTVGTSIHLYANIGNDCMAVNDATVPVEIAVTGSEVKMTLKQIFFMEPEMKQADKIDKDNTTEVFTFVSAN